MIEIIRIILGKDNSKKYQNLFFITAIIKLKVLGGK